MTLNELRKKTAALPGSVTLPSGRNRWVFRYYTPDRKRVKLTFATEEEALEAKLNQHLSKKVSGETGVLTAEQVRIATTIFTMCGDRDPIEAVRHGLDVKEGKVGGKTCDAVEKYLADFDARVKAKTASAETLRTKRNHLLTLATSQYGGRRLGELTKKDMFAFLTSGPWAPVTQDGYRRDVAGFFAWCIERGELSHDLNPMKDVKPFEFPDKEVEFLNADQMEKLLRWFEENDPGIIPFVCLSAFAGIRTAEVKRLIACDPHEHLIRHEEKTIFLPKHAVKAHKKKKRARLLENLPDTLWKWLAAYPSLQSGNYSKRIKRGKLACGTPDINSVFRHSYITNAVAMWENVGRVMLHTGHINAATLIDHYKGICSQFEGSKYFAIEPSADPKSIERREHQPKLDLGKARAIRYRVLDGETKVALAKEYGVSETLIRQVVKGEKWAG